MSTNSKSNLKLKRMLLWIMAITAVAVAIIMLSTDQGRELLQHPQQLGSAFRNWVSEHRFIAPIAFVTVYITLGALALPLWWMPILSGHGFGLLRGVLWTQIASTCSALIAASLSRFLFGDWFRDRIESHAVRLHSLNEKVGHNGLLVVCAVRLAHFIPAGLSNYAFGLTAISLLDIGVGTLIAGLPSTMAEVTVGAAPRLLEDWRYLLLLAILNIAPIIGLFIRYLKPKWFESVGME